MSSETFAHADYAQPLSTKLKATKTVLKRVYISIQIAQFRHALEQLSDNVLAQIGITRAEIPEYVRKIILEEND